jgi:hypothetical protein
MLKPALAAARHENRGHLGLVLDLHLLHVLGQSPQHG